MAKEVVELSEFEGVVFAELKSLGEDIERRRAQLDADKQHFAALLVQRVGPFLREHGLEARGAKPQGVGVEELDGKLCAVVSVDEPEPSDATKEYAAQE